MPDYGKRESGALKGKGYFGELPHASGDISTELSITVDFGNGEEEIPLLVPTLKKKQIDYLLSGKKFTPEIADIAVEFARARKNAGLPAYATPEEEGIYKIPKE